MATYQSNDDSVLVVIGSGAGGGTLANELCQKGIKVVLLEAGKRESPESFVNDEWASFGQLAWLDKRTTSGSWQVAKDFSGLPAWICKTVGGSTTHWAGASLPAPTHSRSLRPLIEGDASRDFAYSEWELRKSRCGVDLALRTVRTRTHKLTLELNSGAGELYDLAADPLEMDNRFGDPGVARVQRELADMIASRPDDARREPLPQVGMA